MRSFLDKEEILKTPHRGIVLFINRATTPFLFLRIVLMLTYYVLEYIIVLISKKCP